jgi:hypothetical protein
LSSQAINNRSPQKSDGIVMNRRNDPRELSGYIYCLSLFEIKSAQLYRNLSDKVDLPLVKSLLLEISLDSQKHSALLKGVSETLPKASWKADQCPSKIGEGWQMVDTFIEEVAWKDKIPTDELPQLSEKLAVFEGVMSEEYTVLVQMKTLVLLSEEIQRIYKIDLDKVKGIFTSIIDDEEHHMELLATIRDIFKQKELEMQVEDPSLKYRLLLK